MNYHPANIQPEAARHLVPLRSQWWQCYMTFLSCRTLSSKNTTAPSLSATFSVPVERVFQSDSVIPFEPMRHIRHAAHFIGRAARRRRVYDMYCCEFGRELPGVCFPMSFKTLWRLRYIQGVVECTVWIFDLASSPRQVSHFVTIQYSHPCDFCRFRLLSCSPTSRNCSSRRSNFERIGTAIARLSRDFAIHPRPTLMDSVRQRLLTYFPSKL